MTIFPAKNRKGQPTGTWLVEVRKMEKGVSKTIRKRTKDYAEAKIIEASLRGEPIPKFQVQKPLIMPPTKLPATEGISSILTDTSYLYVMNLRKLYEGAKSIYRGNKDEQQSCERLYAALDIIGLDLDIKDLRTPAMDFLVEILRARGLSPKTINRYLYAVSGALRWALSRELIPGMPIVPRQNEGVGRINYLTEEDQGRLLQWLNENAFEDVAFATEILLVTGFRISEFLGLKRGDIRDGWVILHPGQTKNNQGREVYVGDLAAALKAKIVSGLPSYTRITKGFSEASNALGISPKVTPHVLRHTTATRLTTAGVSLATVGKILGHKSLVTTQKYAHVENQALIAASKLLRVTK